MIIIRIVILLLLLVPSVVFSADPVLFFSDLSDGPRTGWNGSSTKGAAVTVWGLNLSTSGTVYVGTTGSWVASTETAGTWGTTTNNARSMQSVTFFLNSSMASGAQKIKVTVGGVDSNELDFYVRTTGSIFFVDHTNGNDSYNGTRDTFVSGSNGPWKTLAHCRESIGNSNIAYVRSGSSYTEADDYGVFFLDGTATKGAANAYTGLIGYPGEFPTIDLRTNNLEVAFRNNEGWTGAAQYYTIARIKIITADIGDGVSDNCSGGGGVAIGISDNSTSGGSVDKYMRFIGLEVDGASVMNGGSCAGAITVQNASNFWIYGNNIHHWGFNRFDHAIYTGPNASAPNWNAINQYIGWNEIHDFTTGGSCCPSGIYSHPVDSGGSGYADEVYIHDNFIYEIDHGGIFINSRHQDAYVYNNILWNVGYSTRPGLQIDCPDSPTSNIRLYNNTIYDANVSSLAVLLNFNADNGRANVTIRNNIFWTKSGVSYYDLGSGTVTWDYNVCYGNGSSPTCAGTHGINNLDPQMTSPSTGDFSLATGSRSIGAGTDTSAVLTRDYFGLLRSSVFDIGATEYAAGGDTTAPAVTVSTSDPSSTTSDSFSVTGTASDAVGVTEVT